MEEKTNNRSENDYGSFDSENNSMPDITESNYAADILSSVSDNTSGISSYDYAFGSQSDILSDISPVSPVSSDISDDSSDSEAEADNKTDMSGEGSENGEEMQEEATYDPTFGGKYSYDAASKTYKENPNAGSNSSNSFNNSNSSGSNGSSSTYYYGDGNYSYNASEYRGSQTLGVISMVLGILSMLCCCCGFTGVLLGIPAVILGITHLVKKNKGEGFGITGIITGVLGIILGIIMLIFSVSEDFFNEIINDLDYDYDYSYDYNNDYDIDNDYDFDFDNDYDSWDYYENIYGQWVIENGSGTASYVFNTDGSWGWYKDYNDLSDNYYSGEMMLIYEGQEAFDYYGMDDIEAERMDVDSERFFCFKLYVDTYISRGEDKSAQYGEDDYFSIALYIDEDLNRGKLINIDTADQYDVKKQDLSASEDGGINYMTADIYNGAAKISIPDTWIEYGEQTSDGGTVYNTFASSSGLFEMYVTVQDASGSFGSGQDMIDFCREDIESLFGAENVYQYKVVREENPTVLFCEAYNDENVLHYYCTYNIFDGKHFTMIEFYADEETINSDKETYMDFFENIYESFRIN